MATTLLPKRPLSYRWTIKDAKDFLEEFGGSDLKSPTFPITAPLRTDRESSGLQEKVLWWYLTVYKHSTSYTVEVPWPKYSVYNGAAYFNCACDCTCDHKSDTVTTTILCVFHFGKTKIGMKRLLLSTNQIFIYLIAHSLLSITTQRR